MTIMQGYGQTEAGPVISATPPDAIRIDTVGKPLNGVEVRIADDGEILVRGGLVMDGYWNRPQDTAATIRDGWLHTGDIGELDHGYLRITDRKKDMIVLSGGENVSPAKIEGMLMAEAEIAQAVVTGEGRSGVSALVVPAEGYDDVAVALAVNRTNHASVGDRANTQARGGGAVHDRKRPADAIAENPAGVGDARQCPHPGTVALRMTRSHFNSHCDGAVALLDGAARVFVQSWISVMPRAIRGAHVVREGALSHGRTEEKDLPVTRGHAPQPSGVAARGACRMRQLRRTEASPSRMQPLRLLRWARSGRGREAAAGRRPGLTPDRGALLVRP